jgi:hypothetical protein
MEWRVWASLPAWRRAVRESLPARYVPCRCSAYQWPHRPGGGACCWPETPWWEQAERDLAESQPVDAPDEPVHEPGKPVVEPVAPARQYVTPPARFESIARMQF